MVRELPQCQSRIRVDLSVCYGEAVTVGRSRHSDLWYADPRVSRTHCRFESVSTNNHTAFDVTVTSTSQNGVWLLRRRAPATNGQRGRHILHRCMRDVPVLSHSPTLKSQSKYFIKKHISGGRFGPGARRSSQGREKAEKANEPSRKMSGAWSAATRWRGPGQATAPR